MYASTSNLLLPIFKTIHTIRCSVTIDVVCYILEAQIGFLFLVIFFTPMHVALALYI